MNRFVLVLLTTGVLAVGCKDSKPEAAPAAPPATPVATAAPAPVEKPAEPAAAAAAAGKMAHCPSTVAGAKTEIKDVPGGVEIAVVAKDEASTKEIRTRAAFLAQSAKTAPATVHHNGDGEGGGVYGRCPVVMRNTTVAAADAEGGSKITVTTKDAKEQDWLRRETRTRSAELAMPGADGAGVGKMAHCPNAVRGAMTSIADAKDGVTVTITAKDASLVSEIRSRAQHIATASKLDPKSVTHDGTGNGGGGLGRCPIVLKDTDVEAKDAPGGSVIMVKPKKGSDVKTLQKEVRERSAKFG